MILFDSPTRQSLQQAFPNYRMVFAPCLDSTNLECQRRWQEDPKSHWLILADEQTAGRGQHGRKWVSAPHANLYLSFTWDNCFAHHVGYLNLFLGVVIWETIGNLYPTLRPSITAKWPNDIYVHEKKLAGLLVQNLDNSLGRLVIGIGINVYGLRHQIPETATSLALAMADQGGVIGSMARVALVRGLLSRLQTEETQRYQQDPPLILERFWQATQRTRERPYLYHVYDVPVLATIIALNPDGTVMAKDVAGNTIHLR